MKLAESIATVPAAPTATTATVETPATTGAPLSAGAWLDAAGALLAVLLLILALAALVRRARGRLGGDPLLRVHGSIALGSRERLIVVQAGEAWLLMASSPAGLSLVHRLAGAPGEVGSDDASNDPVTIHDRVRSLLAQG